MPASKVSAWSRWPIIRSCLGPPGPVGRRSICASSSSPAKSTLDVNRPGFGRDSGVCPGFGGVGLLEARPRRFCFGFRILAGTASRARCVGGVGCARSRGSRTWRWPVRLPGAPPLAVEHLDLHPRPERLDHGIVEAVRDVTHGWHQPGGLGPIGERSGSELHTAVEWITAPGGGWRNMLSALVTRAAVGEASIDQPTTRRE
jgi:hypothetical protein